MNISITNTTVSRASGKATSSTTFLTFNREPDLLSFIAGQGFHREKKALGVFCKVQYVNANEYLITTIALPYETPANIRLACQEVCLYEQKDLAFYKSRSEMLERAIRSALQDTNGFEFLQDVMNSLGKEEKKDEQQQQQPA